MIMVDRRLDYTSLMKNTIKYPTLDIPIDPKGHYSICVNKPTKSMKYCGLLGLFFLVIITLINSGPHCEKEVRTYKNLDFMRSSLLLALAGDVETNPGPVKHPCLVCEKPVAKTHRAVMCDTCERWTHIKCGNISPSQYVELSGVGSKSHCRAVPAVPSPIWCASNLILLMMYLLSSKFRIWYTLQL